MKMKTVIAVAVAGAFALPFAAQASADNDRMILAQAGSSGTTGAGAPSQGVGGSTGGTAAGEGTRATPETGTLNVRALDKNGDGYISRDEASGHEDLNPRFSEYDTDRDDRLSSTEWGAIGAPRGSAVSGSSNTPPAGGPGVGGTSAERQPPETGGKPSK